MSLELKTQISWAETNIESDQSTLISTREAENTVHFINNLMETKSSLSK